MIPLSPHVCSLAHVTYRFHQTAGTAMELPSWSPSWAGHSEGHRPGSPDGAAAPTARSGLSPGAAVDGREATVEFLAGLSPFQPQGGDGLWGPASVARGRRGRGARPWERGRGMASLEEGAQACHCQRLWTDKSRSY